MSEIKTAKNKTNGNKHKLPCIGDCNANTNHEVINSVQNSGYVEDEEYDLNWCQEFEIVQCLGCEQISFRMESSNSEDIDPNTDEPFISETLYPRRDKNRVNIAQSIWYLSSKLSNLYEETSTAMDNELKVLSGIGMRAILETVCNDQEAKGKDLFEKIDWLEEEGVLGRGNAGILHKIRLLGNDSAHEAKPQQHAQLELAWEVIVNLLNNIYVIPARSKEVFKKK
ncbi:MAG: DUF4145 domain-containing protein [Devosiaceae bacterium]|nr:DUF4145 domain-containing protein [Devosiaceae bacterium]